MTRKKKHSARCLRIKFYIFNKIRRLLQGLKNNIKKIKNNWIIKNKIYFKIVIFYKNFKKNHFPLIPK